MTYLNKSKLVFCIQLIAIYTCTSAVVCKWFDSVPPNQQQATCRSTAKPCHGASGPAPRGTPLLTQDKSNNISYPQSDLEPVVARAGHGPGQPAACMDTDTQCTTAHCHIHVRVHIHKE